MHITYKALSNDRKSALKLTKIRDIIDLKS